MLVLTALGDNTITVTWFQRASTGNRYQLVMQHLATNTTSVVTLLKSSNSSLYPLRYDRFTFSGVSTWPTGQFRYVVYDTNSTYQNAVAVVETGLGLIAQTPTSLPKYTNAITYAAYNGAGIFDPTFDPTFN